MIETQDAILARLTHALVERFAPERIVLFGSRARGDHHPESDYDLMMVLGDAQHSEDVVRSAVQSLRANVEIFVDTREGFEHRRSDVGTLAYAADQEGRILYARSPVRETQRVRERPNDPPESLERWIARAQSDFAMMEVALEHGPDVRDAAVFHAHQAVEKLLKAVLVSRHVPPPRTHELPQLLTMLPNTLREDRELAESCEGLQKLWPNSRDPQALLPTAAQADQAVRWARRAREIVSTVIALSAER